VVLVSLSDSLPPLNDTPPNALTTYPASSPVFGDFLAVLSAVFYALYVILLKVQLPLSYFGITTLIFYTL